MVAVVDRDTPTLLAKRREQVRVRLSDVDTPERVQPWGRRAHDRLAALTFSQQVEVLARDIDRYEPTVGRVRIGGVDISAEMIREGSAWVYRRYSYGPELLRLEAKARVARRGLWWLPEADRMPPWEWRAAERQARAPS